MRVCNVAGCNSPARKRGFQCHRCYSRKWRERNPWKAAYNAAKANAKRRGKVFTLTLFDFCALFGKVNLQERGPLNDDLQIDRIDNKRGYEPGNVRLIPGIWNREKYTHAEPDPF